MPMDPCVFSTLRAARLEATTRQMRDNCRANCLFHARSREQVICLSRRGADAFLSEAGDFFLKVHDSLKSCVAILKLGKVQGGLLRKSMNLELDQSIDFLPEVQEQWLRHREQLLPCYPRCDVNAV
jgi:hypothetical protein